MRPSDLKGVLTVPAFTVCCMATAVLPACNELKQTKTLSPSPHTKSSTAWGPSCVEFLSSPRLCLFGFLPLFWPFG